MDIMNELTPKRFNDIDDMLAFVSIYDDENRLKSYKKLLGDNRSEIKGKVCVEVGCGFGILSEYMANLGAEKVYAVEANPLLYELALERLQKYPNVTVVLSDIREFQPDQPVDVLLQELYGQLLYDEDIYVLDELKFAPKQVFPNQAVLMGGLADSADFVDECVTLSVLEKLENCLVSGLFDDEDVKLLFPVINWKYKISNFECQCDLAGKKGDLLYFGLQIYHNDQFICQAGECHNWSLVWTPRAGDKFSLRFHPQKRGTDVLFEWLR